MAFGRARPKSRRFFIVVVVVGQRLAEVQAEPRLGSASRAWRAAAGEEQQGADAAATAAAATVWFGGGGGSAFYASQPSMNAAPEVPCKPGPWGN